MGKVDSVSGLYNLPHQQNLSCLRVVAFQYALKMAKSFILIFWKVLMTDTSLAGWGVVLLVQETKSLAEAKLSINIPKLRAIWLVLQHWASCVKGYPTRNHQTMPWLWLTTTIKGEEKVAQLKEKLISF